MKTLIKILFCISYILSSSTYELVITLDNYGDLFQGSKVIYNNIDIGKVKTINISSKGIEKQSIITLKIYNEFENINSDMLFKVEDSKLIIDLERMATIKEEEEALAAKIAEELATKKAKEEAISAAKATEEELAAKQAAEAAEAEAKKEAEEIKLAQIEAEKEKAHQEQLIEAAKLAQIEAEKEKAYQEKLAEELKLKRIIAEEEARLAEEARLEKNKEEEKKKKKKEEKKKKKEARKTFVKNVIGGIAMGIYYTTVAILALILSL